METSLIKIEKFIKGGLILIVMLPLTSTGLVYPTLSDICDRKYGQPNQDSNNYGIQLKPLICFATGFFKGNVSTLWLVFQPTFFWTTKVKGTNPFLAPFLVPTSTTAAPRTTSTMSNSSNGPIVLTTTQSPTTLPPIVTTIAPVVTTVVPVVTSTAQMVTASPIVTTTGTTVTTTAQVVDTTTVLNLPTTTQIQTTTASTDTTTTSQVDTTTVDNTTTIGTITTIPPTPTP